MSSLVNPLQLLISEAAKLPSSGEVSKYSQRLNTSSSLPTVILLDVSGSMDEAVETGKRKIDILRKAVNRPLMPDEMVFVFSSTCRRALDFWSIPEPEGSTALHLALLDVIYCNPKHTLIVTDGHPDDPEEALASAERLSGTISTLYIGRDDDHNAIAFCRKLARVGCGTAQVCDITKPQNQLLLKETITALLPSK
jgi:hypothetical protein